MICEDTTLTYSDLHKLDSDLYTIQDLSHWKPPSVTRIIGSGILNTGTRLLIFGDEGSWKSILSIHTAHSIATGSYWLGWSTQQCNVLKIQVELPMYSDRERTLKYCSSHEKIFYHKNLVGCKTDSDIANLKSLAHVAAYPPNIINRTENFIHFDESFGIASLDKNIRACISSLPFRPLVIIFDPLYMVMGGDINKEVDMKKFLDNINIMLTKYEKEGCQLAAIIIHHNRKDHTDAQGQAINMGSQDATGSRALSRWADTIIRLDLDKTNSRRVKFHFTKHRNAENDLPDLELKWHRETLHPQVVKRFIQKDEKEEDELEIRSESEYGMLDC
jgi:RecA-family ATPase